MAGMTRARILHEVASRVDLFRGMGNGYDQVIDRWFPGEAERWREAVLAMGKGARPAADDFAILDRWAHFLTMDTGRAENIIAGMDHPECDCGWCRERGDDERQGFYAGYAADPDGGTYVSGAPGFVRGYMTGRLARSRTPEWALRDKMIRPA